MSPGAAATGSRFMNLVEALRVDLLELARIFRPAGRYPSAPP